MDIDPPEHPQLPDKGALFDAIRKHLKAANAAGFFMHDEEGGYYVAVGQSPESIISLAAPGKMQSYSGWNS